MPALRLLLPGVVALAASRPLGAVRVKEGQVVLPSVLGLAALGLNVALNLVLLPRMGIRGSSIASSICYAALALSYVAIARAGGWPVAGPGPAALGLLRVGGPQRPAATAVTRPAARSVLPWWWAA